MPTAAGEAPTGGSRDARTAHPVSLPGPPGAAEGAPCPAGLGVPGGSAAPRLPQSRRRERAGAAGCRAAAETESRATGPAAPGSFFI